MSDEEAALSLLSSSSLLQLSRDREVLKTPHGILLKSLAQADAGLYHCLATENNFKHTIARVSLRILDRQIAVALTSPDDDDDGGDDDNGRKSQQQQQHPAAQPWPSAPLPSQPEVRLIHQYCQSYWEQMGAQQQQQQQQQKKSKLKSRRHTESLASSGG